MSCGCGKKRGGVPLMMDSQPLLTAPEWGPILWKYLHCLAEKMGFSGNTIMDTDQATYMEVLLNMLPSIIPCKICQEHAAIYQMQSPLPPLKGLYGDALRNTIRTWLFAFHNHVRSINGQPILLSTVEECAALYQGCAVVKQDYTAFVQSVAAAVRQGWVKIEQWKKWYSHSERIRIICGNVVM